MRAFVKQMNFIILNVISANLGFKLNIDEKTFKHLKKSFYDFNIVFYAIN